MKDLFIRILLALELLLAPKVAAQESVPQLTLQWVSTGSEETIAKEISDLYLTLYNSGNLTVRQATVADGFVESLLRSEGVIEGSYFPVELDALLCDLNPTVCVRLRAPAPEATFDDPAAHVGGYLPNHGQWRTKAGDVLTIPDYAFERITILARVPTPEGWSIDTYVPPEGADCSDWKQLCEKVVRRFNPTQIGVQPDSVTILQVQWRTAIPLKRDDSSSVIDGLSAVLIPSEDSGPKVFADPEASLSDAWLNEMVPISPIDMTLESLKGNLEPIGMVVPYQGDPEPFAADQEKLFRLINFPASGSSEAPVIPVGVVVFDSQILGGHCDLPTMYFSSWDSETPPTLMPLDLPVAGGRDSSSCSVLDSLAQKDSDHAMAVLGIIGAQKNGKGIVGINPAAKLLPIAFGRDDPPGTLIRELRLSFPPEVRVANLSFRIVVVNPKQIRDAFEQHLSSTLFVVAAGNEGLELDPAVCAVYPACFNDLDNVITVVGLNGNAGAPEIWKSSTQSTNVNPTFEIGAPAEGVLTTVTNDRFDVKQGTSFAAPQVAAAASLIFSVGEAIYGGDPEAQLSPKTVKDRLVYTADFFPTLATKVYAGRINVDRAITVVDSQFELFNGRRIVGRVIEAPPAVSCSGPDNEEGAVPWVDIRRLAYNEARRRHILYRHDNLGGGRRDAKLVRDLSCSITTTSPIVKVEMMLNGVRSVVEFSFGDIRDYTSPLFDK